MSFPDQLLALHHFVSRILPHSAPSDAPARISAVICNACRRSLTDLHDAERCKDEIWHALRSFSATPSSAQIDDILKMVTVVHRQSVTALRQHKRASTDSSGARFSQWNSGAKVRFEQLVLSSVSGSRITDPRGTTTAIDSISNSSSHPVGSSSSSSSHRSSTTTAARTANSNNSFDPAWLRNRCAQLAVCQNGDATPHEMAISVMLQLCNKSLTDEYLQSDLYDCFAGDFDAVADVLQKRAQIISNRDAIQADGEQAREIHEQLTSSVASPSPFYSRASAQQPPQQQRQRQQHFQSNVYVRDVRLENRRKEQMKKSKKMMRKGGGVVEDEDDDFIMNSQDFSGSAYAERQRAFPGVSLQGDSVIGAVDRVGLPKGATRQVGKGYEEIFIPPPDKSVRESDLVDVATGLGEHPELLQAMRGVKTLNRLQSSVFPVAFQSDENMLVCAPTGAGKTNVALLTIFREIVSVKLREKRAFKVVYVAPMKALAAEVTEKFSSRLGPLGLTVREFTGDISPSRAETLATHVLVTTPEKWDVVTRKTGSDVGEALTLFIIDEIHLLHDERGAVLESIVARTLRFSETAQRQIRLVGLSATLPNYADVGSFMRVDPQKGLFHFDGSHRPVPLSQTFIGVSEGQNSSTNEARRRKEAKVHEMAWKKVKDSLMRGHQAMIFVHSRKGTANAAREMLHRATQDAVGDIFLGGQVNQNSASLSLKDKKQNRDGDGDDDGGDNHSAMPSWAAKEIGKSKTADIRELCMRGIGIHNAGLPRPDRKLVERLFAEGVLRLLCCTATLAWGVNLPARTVVIMGTEVYNAEKGGFEQLGMLDVMQIFGRAGRPQFDTEGEGTIITDHEHLSKYLNLLTSSIPIESQLGASASRMADHLNAEIVSGTVSSIGDGVRWLSYTYLSVRMPQNPLVYGINWDEVHADAGLHSRRAQLIEQAAKALDDARMCRYDDRTGALSPLDLGRVSSHFYVSHETILLWTEQLSNFSYGPAITINDWKRVYGTVIHAVACATEFEQMRSREEEGDELAHLMKNSCPVPLKREFGAETREGKVAILLQAHISRANIRMSDLSYIVQSATRLLRALFEISLRRGMPSVSVAALELARASESRIWPFQHPLWQFTYLSRRERGLLITPETIAAIESSGESTDIASLRSRTREDLSELIRAPRIVATVEKVLKSVPTLDIVDTKVAALSKTLLRIDVKILANFTWHDSLHGMSESWWLWIEDKEEYRIYHSHRITLTKRQLQELNADVFDGQKPGDAQRQTLDLSFTVAVFDPPSAEYWVRIESDRWHTGGGSTAQLTVANMLLPLEVSFKTDVSSVTPTEVRSVFRGDEASWFAKQATHFNLAQSAIMYTACNTNEHMLICAPSGCGDLTMIELAMLRALNTRNNAAIVILTLHEGALQLMSRRWKSFAKTFSRGRLLAMTKIDSLSIMPSPEQLGQEFSIIVTVPDVWVDYLHTVAPGKEDRVLSRVSAFIIHDLHRASHPSNSATELVISRVRAHRRSVSATNSKRDVNNNIPRLVALSAMIPNAPQVAEWLGVSRKMGLFCFGDEARPISCETYLISVAGDRYSSRMQSINRPLYSAIQRYSHKKPVLVFVSSRRQSLLTARDLLRLASLDDKETLFVGKIKRTGSDSRSTSVENAGSGQQQSTDLSRYFRVMTDVGLRQLVPKGIALYHENISAPERDAIEELFNAGHLLAVIATFATAPSISLRAHSVIIKGTETFNVKRRRYEDIRTPDIVHMIGRAGRFGIDDTSYATIFVHEPRQTLFKKLVREPLPLESGLLDARLHDILLQEIVDGHISDVENSIVWLRNTMLFQRLFTNPGLYGLKKGVTKKREKAGLDQQTFDAERRNDFCRQLLTEHLDRLQNMGCVQSQQNMNLGETSDSRGVNRKKKHTATNTKKIVIKATELGQLCRRWRMRSESAVVMKERLDKLAQFLVTATAENKTGDERKLHIEEVMNTLSACDEIKDLGKDYEEDAVWKAIFDKVTRHFVQCHMFTNEDVAARTMKLNGWAESSQKRGKLLCYTVLTPHPTRAGGGFNGGFRDDNAPAKHQHQGVGRSEGVLAQTLTQVVNFALDICIMITASVVCVQQLVRLKQCVSMRQAPGAVDFWTVCPAVHAFDNGDQRSGLPPSRKLVEKGKAEGWQSLDDVWARPQEFSMFVARSCMENQRAAIMRWVNAYPKLRIVSVSRATTGDSNVQDGDASQVDCVKAHASPGGFSVSLALDSNDLAMNNSGTAVADSGVKVVLLISNVVDDSVIAATKAVISSNECVVEVPKTNDDVLKSVATQQKQLQQPEQQVRVWVACEEWIGAEVCHVCRIGSA